jgi:hypothetical protein
MGRVSDPRFMSSITYVRGVVLDVDAAPAVAVAVQLVAKVGLALRHAFAADAGVEAAVDGGACDGASARVRKGRETLTLLPAAQVVALDALVAALRVCGPISRREVRRARDVR